MMKWLMWLALVGGVSLAAVAPAEGAESQPALVFEPATGMVLYAEDPDRLWHPASLTKLMTAYLTFQAIRAHKLSLDDEIVCSANANRQAPSKIGLPVGATMSVDTALKALIVKSANDVAVMLAEKVGGDEETFVKRMNDAARQLGMTRTSYVNPNGLPDDKQLTSARDLGILAQALLKEFPQFNYLYALEHFKVGNIRLSTHNRLLQSFQGADGMKTGYICDSGFNVVASATRDGHRLIAVVLGARSGHKRSMRAIELLDHGFRRYWWKTLFAEKLNDLPMKANLANEPGDLSWEVCRRR